MARGAVVQACAAPAASGRIINIGRGESLSMNVQVELSTCCSPVAAVPVHLSACTRPTLSRVPVASAYAPGGLASGNPLDAELGYGLPVGRRFVGTPRFGVGATEYGRDYRLGYGLGVLNRGGLTFELGVDAQRRESPVLGGASNGVLGRAMLGW